MGVGAGDYDRDGWLDIVKTNFDDDTTSLYRNLGDGTFDDATVAAGWGSTPATWAGAVGFLDFDLDSWPDILIVNGHVYPEADRVGGRYSYEQRKLLYRNLGNGRFEDVSSAPAPACSRKIGARRRLRRPLQHRPPGRRRQQHARRADACSTTARPRAGHSLVVQLIGDPLEPQRHRRACHGPAWRPAPHRRGAQRRQLLFAERPAAARRPRRAHAGRSRRGRLAVRCRPRRSPGLDADQLVVIREGAASSQPVRTGMPHVGTSRQPLCGTRLAPRRRLLRPPNGSKLQS